MKTRLRNCIVSVLAFIAGVGVASASFAQAPVTVWTGKGSDGIAHGMAMGWDAAYPVVSIDNANGIDVLSGPADVRNFGATCNGSADDTAGFQAAAASGKQLLVAGACTLASDVALPANIDVKILPNASISVAAGHTLTIQGRVDAPLSQVFVGNVVGMRQARPEWFGAKRDGVADDSGPINQALTAISASANSYGDRQKLLLASGTYLVCANPINASPTATVNLEIAGGGILNGTVIVPCKGFSDYALKIHGQPTSSGAQTTDIYLHDFRVDAGECIATCSGLAFVPEGGANSLQGCQNSLVENVLIINAKVGILYQNTRLIKFDRIGIWNAAGATGATGMLINVDGASSFTGDVTVRNSQFVGNGVSNFSKDLMVQSLTGASGGVAGLHFDNDVFYAAQNEVYAISQNPGININDVWFTNCQFDGDGAPDWFYVEADSGSAMYDWHIVDNYFTQAGVSANNLPLNFYSNGGNLISWDFSHNYVNGSSQCAGCVTLQTSGGDTWKISDNQFLGMANSSGAVVNIVNTNSPNISGNNLGFGSGSNASFISIVGTTAHATVVGNSAGGHAGVTVSNGATGADNFVGSNSPN